MVRKLVARALVIEASSGTGVAGWGDGDCVREAESLLVLVVPALVSLREPRGELAPEPELPRRFGGAALGLGFDLELHWDWDWDTPNPTRRDPRNAPPRHGSRDSTHLGHVSDPIAPGI